jgi:hypothetical protein
MQGLTADTFPMFVIGAAYLIFGGWAYSSAFDPFFFIFLVPAVCFLVAAWRTRRSEAVP